MSQLEPPIAAQVWKEDDPFVYLHCPGCGCSLIEPFSRLELLRFYAADHNQGNRGSSPNGTGRCRVRFVFHPDPHGSDHRVQVLNHNTHAEAYLREAYLDPKTFHRALSIVARIDQEARCQVA